ncbi:MAG: DUF2723 domain-containing protein [Bacteroidota bacterium]|nr:DUF2723 domain-containing protein [Bacteroidota bacterium]
MDRFKRWNNLTGWLSFLIAATVYLLTIEPTVSYWDCGEFIACAYHLEIGHPPGAPLFLMLAKVFSLLAPNPTKVALMINAMSGIASAFTIMFLCWTITHLARKLMVRNGEISTGKMLAILGAGLVGALAYTFTDSFWFSAVEGEVYGTSSLFTAVVFWAILKWEEAADESHANRWIIHIAYLMGLSIGVHLLNLLTIPALILVIYFRKFRPTIWGFMLAVLVSFVILAAVQYGIIQGTLKLAAIIELWFVNRLGFPFHSGIVCFALTLIVLLFGGIWLTLKFRKPVLNAIFMAVTMIVFGYSSYAMIVIRSLANPPLNENSPNDTFSLLSYLSRDQYGDRPLLYGQYYNAPVTQIKKGEPIYIKGKDKYIIAEYKDTYVYDPRFTTWFPRMYSNDAGHISVYKAWGNISGKPMTVTRDGEQMVDYCPTLSENFAFFIKYQVGFMYFRYFMWNFAGRQNEIQGNGGILYGNFITGISLIDNYFWGPQDKLPSYLKENKGRNKYYLLPLLLGVIGMFVHILESRRDFLVVFLLFFMTGIAIVLYLNQTPLQVRERDYAYAGSFYAFSIWIGLGILSLFNLLRKLISDKQAAIAATGISLLTVPTVMAAENWDDHDRSGRYTARDMAYNCLNSCAPNAILITNGDNDTFPLWYLQEVEGVRTDVRVVNLLLFNSDWCISQMQRRVYESAPLPISFRFDQYRQGRRNFVYLVEKTKESLNLKDAMKYVAREDSGAKYFLQSGEILDLLPSKKFSLPVDTYKVIRNGTVKPELAGLVSSKIDFSINRSYVSKNVMIIMDILANNNWERPIYYLAANHEGTLGLENYFQLEGFAYRLTPVYSEKTDRYDIGRVKTETMYKNLMEKFRWTRMNDPKVYIDDNNKDMFAIMRMRINFARLAQQLWVEGKPDSARKVVDRCLNLMPAKIYKHDVYSFKLAEVAYKIGATTEARKIINEYSNKCFEDLAYFNSMPKHLFNLLGYETGIARQTIDHLIEIAGNAEDSSMVEHLKSGKRGIKK